MADKRVLAVALDLGGDDSWYASSQLAVRGDERAWVGASRLGVRRGERVLRRDLEVGRELVRVGPSGERRVLRSGARGKKENDMLGVDALLDKLRGVPIRDVEEQVCPVVLAHRHLECLSVGVPWGVSRVATISNAHNTVQTIK